ncbi:hypothetical protein V1L54_05565 [Streptomyces sp. TRM 70361]|uniref:hypothetical protein n=1 Tax=Streptomyces sp. TRM 70361 TaxID=3116553 RepID=UPI002E7BB211|nr:hypothetical protein [Streptomyces sp. TRM 70361]MEE1938885.1 hypothetical protein [Streptomyces sp. TRM 70361]
MSSSSAGRWPQTRSPYPATTRPPRGGQEIGGERRVVVLRGLLGHVVGAIRLERLGPLAGGSPAAVPDLPEAEFPQLAATARDARRVGAGREFTGGFAAPLRGLEP